MKNHLENLGKILRREILFFNLFAFCLFFSTGSLKAQTTGFDSLYAFHPDTSFWGNMNVVEHVLPDDSLIYITGRTLADTLNYNTNQAVYIACVNYAGHKKWERRLSFSGPSFTYTGSYFRSRLLTKINDNLFATAGHGIDFSNAQYLLLNPFLYLFDKNGDSVRKVDIDVNPLEYQISPYSLSCDRQKDILLGGLYAHGLGTSDTVAMFLNKYDSSGNLKWHRMYIGLGGEVRGLLPEKIIMANGNSSDYLIVGKSGITDSMADARQSMMMIARMDSAGNMIWMKTLPKMRNYFVHGVWEYYEDLIPAKDGSGYYFMGYESQADTASMPSFYVGKIDEGGNIIWAKQYVYPGSRDVTTFDINQKTNGDLLVSANYVQSLPSFKASPYLLCLDKQGNVKWAKEYRKYFCDTFIREDVWHTALGPNNKIVMGGVSATLAVGGLVPVSPCFPYRYAMGRLIVADSMGMRNDTDTIYDNTPIQVITMPLKLKNVALPKVSLVLYPNPAKHELNILLANLQPAMGDELQVLNIRGREMLRGQMNSGRGQLNIGSLPPGSYILRLYRKGVAQASARFVKQ